MRSPLRKVAVPHIWRSAKSLFYKVANRHTAGFDGLLFCISSCFTVRCSVGHYASRFAVLFAVLLHHFLFCSLVIHCHVGHSVVLFAGLLCRSVSPFSVLLTRRSVPCSVLLAISQSNSPFGVLFAGVFRRFLFSALFFK